MIKVTYPGKLYLLGEYLVLEPGKSALVMAVNKTLSATISESKTYSVYSVHGNVEGMDIFNSSVLPHVSAALNTATSYLELNKVHKKVFSITITSELDSNNNKKYGLGSSGVVIVAVIDAVLKHHDVIVDALTLFKLSVFAQYSMDELSSGGDIAASIYGGLVFYTRYDIKELHDDIRCVQNTWNFLRIERLERDFNVVVGWTKTSHKTPNSIRKVEEMKEKESKEYQRLINEAELIVNSSFNDIEKAVSDYRSWLIKFGHWADINIETKPLQTFIETSIQEGWASKVSGAGGGDCAIAITKHSKNTKLLESKLRLKDIEILEGVIPDAF